MPPRTGAAQPEIRDFQRIPEIGFCRNDRGSDFGRRRKRNPGKSPKRSLQKPKNFLSWQKSESDKNFPMLFLRTLPTKYLLCLGALVAAMLLFTIFGGRGLLQIYHVKEERDRIHLSNARLREENQKLSQQVQRLRYQKEEVEKIAREELGLVKKGEIIYQFER